MAFNPLHGHAALRRGRNSEPSSTYFLTVCTDNQERGLTDPEVAKTIWQEITLLEADCSWHLRCAVIMPDHLHLLIQLGQRLSLGQTIQRLKSKTGSALRIENLKWERDFFDRKLRPDEPLLPVFLYIYLNPYRANFCKRTEPWVNYRCSKTDWVWFGPLLDQDLPPPEWLA